MVDYCVALDTEFGALVEGSSLDSQIIVHWLKFMRFTMKWAAGCTLFGSFEGFHGDPD